jgi:O-antigen ligase
MQPDARQWHSVISEAGGLSVALLLPLWFHPWQQPAFEPAKVLLFRSIVAIMATAALTAWMIERRSRYPNGTMVASRFARWRARNPLFWPALAFVAAHLLATLVAVKPMLSLWGPPDNPQGLVTTLCTVAFFLLLAAGLRTQAQFERMVTALVLGSVPVVVYGLSQFASLDPLPWITDSVSPVLSTMGRSNFLGAYLAMVIPFTLLRIADERTDRRQARYGLVLALQVLCLWLTLARAAWLAFLAGALLFLGLLAQRRHSRTLASLVIVVALLGLALYAAMNVTALPRWGRPTIETHSGSGMPFADLRAASVNARLTIWKTTLGLVRERWLLGYGPEQFPAVFAAHYPPELTRFEGPQVMVDDPHNLFLDQLMAAGVVGLAALFGVLSGFYRMAVAAWRRCRDRYDENALAALMAAATAFLVQAQFNPDVIVLSVLFWLMLALGVAWHARLSASNPKEVMLSS